MTDDGIEIRIRAWANALTGCRPCRFVIRHTKRTWFRLSRTERNRILRGEDVRAVPRVHYRLTRATRAILAARTAD